MARSFNGTIDRIDYGNVDAVGAQAQTFHCKVYSNNSIGGDEWLLMKHTSGDGSFGPLFQLGNNDAIGVQVNYTGTTLKHISNVSAIPTAQWFDAIFTWDGSVTAANVHIYVNNVEVSYFQTQNGSGTPDAPAGTWSLGGWLLGDGPNLDGRMADIGWWNRVLTAGERKSLLQGYAPQFIPKGLKFAPDLIRNQRDLISGQTGTLDGTTVVVHPRVINPFKRKIMFPPIAISVGGIMTCNTGYWGAI
jgi:hypothetical protein